MNTLNYAASGVDYDSLDAFKRACQHAAASTTPALALHQLSEPAGTRGESAYLLEAPDQFLAHVEEGLGTKNLVADAMLQLTGTSYYHHIGADTVATIVNDLITCGALPLSVAMHAAVGDAAWFNHARRAADLAEGFAQGCKLANAVWGGGETPALKGVIEPNTIALAGSALGRIKPKSLRITGNVQPNDAIIFLASSGVHTNGLSLCRLIAQKIPQGYLTPLPSGRTFGQTLLDPSVIYVRFIAACQQANIPIHYAAHMTGHGWRKLMRLDLPFVYQITHTRTPPEIFTFISQTGLIDPKEMYATFNMGVGFAVFVSPTNADRCLLAAKQSGYDAYLAGSVQKSADRKAVEIPSLNITFESDSLHIR